MRINVIINCKIYDIKKIDHNLTIFELSEKRKVKIF